MKPINFRALANASIPLLENLAKELSRLPSEEECAERLRATPEFSDIEPSRLGSLVRTWRNIQLRRAAKTRQRLQTRNNKLRGKLRALLRNPPRHIRRRLAGFVLRTNGIDDLVVELRKTPEFSSFTPQELRRIVRSDLRKLQREEKRRRKQSKKAIQANAILMATIEELTRNLNRTPTASECVTHIRQQPAFSHVEQQQLHARVEQALQTQVRQTIKKQDQAERQLVTKSIEALAQERQRAPTFDECIDHLRYMPEFVSDKPERLTRLVQHALKSRYPRRNKRKRKKIRSKGGDAMNRAIRSGFESNRRRH